MDMDLVITLIVGFTFMVILLLQYANSKNDEKSKKDK